MRYHKIADETIRRLPIYLRGLLSLSEQNQANISSQDMADLLGVNPWQIRKDFSYFGVFGTAGVGYNIRNLTKQIKKILKLDVVHKAALVGAVNLGSAIMAYPGFGTYGFDIAAAFDTNPKKIGRKVKNITIEDVSISKSKPFLGTAAEQMELYLPKKSGQQCVEIRPCCRDPSDVRFRRAFSRD